MIGCIVAPYDEDLSLFEGERLLIKLVDQAEEQIILEMIIQMVCFFARGI